MKVLFVNFGDEEAMYAMKAISALRSKGINSEIFPDSAKMKKQMNYANKRSIPYVVIVGSDELKGDSYLLKNMQNGEQKNISLEELLEAIDL